MIPYKIPDKWMKYEFENIAENLIKAKVAIETLKAMPYQLDWVKDLQKIELKREVAGTSRIEGADFTEKELDEAMKESPEELFTRSQRQAHAAVQTYRWIATLPDDKPINAELILDIHRKIITGADDDRCEPGRIRTQDQNVNFGQPRHRGADGGEECRSAFEGFVNALNSEFKSHDPIIQALAAHYHLAAMHPFLDGNGRCDRAMEALMLQRAGLRDICFISMSNYYYEEKLNYLGSLGDVRENNFNLNPFLNFALKGIALQSGRATKEIKLRLSKAVFRNLMYDLFGRLESPRKRVIAERQIEILKLLLERDNIESNQFLNLLETPKYARLKNPKTALIRDLAGLWNLDAIDFDNKEHIFRIRLDWPKQISESTFMERIKELPKSKTFSFLTKE